MKTYWKDKDTKDRYQEKKIRPINYGQLQIMKRYKD